MTPIIILTTTKDHQEAKKIVIALLEAKLIACGNILPSMESFFHWDGAIQQEEEILVLLKSNKENFLEVEKKIQEHHSYDVPEIIALDINLGSEKYLAWMSQTFDH